MIFSTSVANSESLHPLAKNLGFERAKGDGTFPKSQRLDGRLGVL